MNVRFLRLAERQLRAIVDLIAQDRPRAATALVRRINDRFVRVAETGFVGLGAVGRVAGTRYFVDHPYIITYRHDPARDEIVVLSIVHGARRRPTAG